jgi:hypothetical protein
MGAPGVPPASNLTPARMPGWSQVDFFTAMRHGRRPDGSMLHEIMPWTGYRDMTDEELQALWLYLRSVPPRAFGGK